MYGACYCTEIRFRLTAAPIFTHACHCLNCQKRSGSAFAMSSFVLAENLEILKGEPEFYPEEVNMKILPVSRCPECETHLWYTPDPRLLIVRTGLFGQSDIIPQAHIFVDRKQPWVVLNDAMPQFATSYGNGMPWPAIVSEALRE